MNLICVCLNKHNYLFHQFYFLFDVKEINVVRREHNIFAEIICDYLTSNKEEVRKDR